MSRSVWTSNDRDRYDVELGGVGISSKPSYYPPNDPHVPNQPIFATQTAIFRLASVPTRSPRSVRSVQLPFMPSSKESAHSHRLAGRYVHPNTISTSNKASSQDVQHHVRAAFEQWGVGEVSLSELWSVKNVAEACGGSQRYLVGSLGGWGDCEAHFRNGIFTVTREKGRGFVVVWNGFVPKQKKEDEWGKPMEGIESDSAQRVGGW